MSEAPALDTAALAAHDDTNHKPLGEHLAEAQAAAERADALNAEQAAQPAPTEVQTAAEARLTRRVAELEDRLRYFEDRRAKEQALLAQRDAAIAAIEGAKARVQSCKGELAEVEEDIAALLKEPLPQSFAETPIGQAIAAATASAPPEPVAPPAWLSLLPAVAPEAVRLLDESADDELPTVDALCGALLAPQAMMGGKRVVKQSVQVYGTPWIVTHLWKDEASGACRANVVRLYTKDEWQQTHEAKYGRAVGDFDQSDEAKVQRQAGGEWCGLTVKVSRKVYVVGPQESALHLAYCPPEPAPAAPAEPVADAQPSAEAPAEPAAQEPEPWSAVGARAQQIIEATGMSAAAYALQYKLPYIALAKLLSTGQGPEDAAIGQALRDAFPPFEDLGQVGAEDDGHED